MTLYRKRGDTRPFAGRAVDAAGPVDLTSAALRLVLQQVAGEKTVVAEPAADLDQVVNKGRWSYDPLPEDVDTAGVFHLELEVTFPDGTIATFPEDGYVDVVIRRDLA